MRRAMLVQRDAGALQHQRFEGRLPPCRDQHGIELFAAGQAVDGAKRDRGHALFERHLMDGGVRIKIELAREAFREGVTDALIRDACHLAAATEYADFDAQSREALRQFERERSGAEDGEPFRQRLELEDIVARKQALAEHLEFGWHVRHGAAGDDDAACVQPPCVIDDQPMALGTAGLETGAPAHHAFRRKRGDLLEYRGDEVVAFAPHELHDQPAVDLQRRNSAYAAWLQLPCIVYAVRDSQQQL